MFVIPYQCQPVFILPIQSPNLWAVRPVIFRMKKQKTDNRKLVEKVRRWRYGEQFSSAFSINPELPSMTMFGVAAGAMASQCLVSWSSAPLPLVASSLFITRPNNSPLPVANADADCSKRRQRGHSRMLHSYYHLASWLGGYTPRETYPPSPMSRIIQEKHGEHGCVLLRVYWHLQTNELLFLKQFVYWLLVQ